MFKAEPKTILNFLQNHFDVLVELFNHQNADGLITREIYESVCLKQGQLFNSRLREYRVIRPMGSDYEMRDVYYKMLEFLLFEFKPLLPETIEKYKGAINELFQKIRKGETNDRDILQERIKNLSHQVREFVDLVERNAFRLLSETRDLKSNIERVEYRDKVHRASFWIEYYILPLNKILDVKHMDSLASKLVEVSEYANRKRLDFADEMIRTEFEKLYSQLIQTNSDLLRQSKILTNELLPLLERIRTESLILTGWIEFLRHPYKTETPPLLKGTRHMPYAKDMLYKVREFFDQFLISEEVLIEEGEIEIEKWIFDHAYYRNKLEQELPCNDFFKWCSIALKDGEKQTDTDKFFALTALLFDEEFHIDFPKKSERTTIQTRTSKISVPKLKIERAIKIA